MVQRVGIVSNTSVSYDELPPGIFRFIDYIGRPWNSSPEEFRIQIMGEIKKEKDFSDRCIHHLARTENKEELINITFDWQRNFSLGKPLALESLIEILRDAEEEALAYFEEVAEGNRFDEDLIRQAK